MSLDLLRTRVNREANTAILKKYHKTRHLLRVSDSEYTNFKDCDRLCTLIIMVCMHRTGWNGLYDECEQMSRIQCKLGSW
nr:hypothetical protein [Tanacetum cinerariifolium]